MTMACEVAASAQTGQLVLFHHDPAYTDDMLAGMEANAQKSVRGVASRRMKVWRSCCKTIDPTVLRSAFCSLP
ncbi:MAG: hypothetical protein MZV64_17080 [Ignavibacteriales bacterium]|nr:hypothetical protein [Ignavibacteriales bacterium]